MADEMSMALAELLSKINLEPDFLREGVRAVGAGTDGAGGDAEGGGGAPRAARGERSGYRNG